MDYHQWITTGNTTGNEPRPGTSLFKYLIGYSPQDRGAANAEHRSCDLVFFVGAQLLVEILCTMPDSRLSQGFRPGKTQKHNRLHQRTRQTLTNY